MITAADKSAPAVLLAAARYLEIYGHRQDGMDVPYGLPCCVLRALDHVSGHCPDEARAELVRHLGGAPRDRAWNGLVIARWNDRHGRTADEAIAALRAAGGAS
jgi:hypothetical protein